MPTFVKDLNFTVLYFLCYDICCRNIKDLKKIKTRIIKLLFYFYSSIVIVCINIKTAFILFAMTAFIFK